MFLAQARFADPRTPRWTETLCKDCDVKGIIGIELVEFIANVDADEPIIDGRKRMLLAPEDNTLAPSNIELSSPPNSRPSPKTSYSECCEEL